MHVILANPISTEFHYWPANSANFLSTIGFKALPLRVLVQKSHRQYYWKEMQIGLELGIVGNFRLDLDPWLILKKIGMIANIENCLLRMIELASCPLGPVTAIWGGLTNRNICNIYGGAHLASRPKVQRLRQERL